MTSDNTSVSSLHTANKGNKSTPLTKSQKLQPLSLDKRYKITKKSPRESDRYASSSSLFATTSDKTGTFYKSYRQRDIRNYLVAGDTRVPDKSNAHKDTHATHLKAANNDTKKMGNMFNMDGPKPTNELISDEVKKPKRRKKNSDLAKFLETRRNTDIEKYRNGYPGKPENLQANDNYLFYKNKKKCQPDGYYIDKFLESWWGQYDKLEMKHGYIQWLFPIRENGMNWEAQDLQLHEAKKIKEDPEAMKRLVLAYRLMLDFYGIDMYDESSGAVRRMPQWKRRFHNLNTRGHNFLRITRILKCLGELGLEHYKAPLVQFFLNESLICGTLPNLYDSCVSYWIETVKDDKTREDLHKFASHNIEYETESEDETTNNDKHNEENTKSQQETPPTP